MWNFFNIWRLGYAFQAVDRPKMRVVWVLAFKSTMQSGVPVEDGGRGCR